MSSYVLDASVAAKWFLPHAGETLVEESLEILNDYAKGRTALLVPDLFWPELGNIFWKAVRAGRMSRESAEEAVLAITSQKFPTSSSLPLLSDAFGIAVSFQRTVYDSIYVALAITSGRPLLTADERLANALAAHFPIRWLGSAAA
jgi:predicted nucleic acid-binding protein